MKPFYTNFSTPIIHANYPCQLSMPTFHANFISLIFFSGVADDALKMMGLVFGDPMDFFYEMYGFRKGGTPGGGFTGKELRKMFNDENLGHLRQLLGESDVVDMWIEYLSSILNLHRTCVKDTLPEDLGRSDIERYKKAFKKVNEKWNLSETVKVHILCDHVGDFFANEKRTMKR